MYGGLVTLAEEVPQLILEGRRQAGLTQAMLAALVDVDQSTVSRWERGKELPGLHQADLVFESLGIAIQLHRSAPPAAEDDGVDRAQIERRLALTPRERLDANAAFLRFAEKARRG
jgi:ribosome-binding protein aMBF1 (putative translation factor)